MENQERQRPRRKWRIAAAALAALIGVGAIYMCWDPHGLLISDGEWESIEVGMTKEQVRRILKKPVIERTDEWVYYPLNDVIYRYIVTFDDQGRVEWKHTLD